MALTKNPKLALIPSGYKASKVYSVLPSDGVGDFDFSRSGNATRVNKQGLIETVSSNVPRLNYPLIDGVVSGCPSLLLENSATNYIVGSNSFIDWSGGLVISENYGISPDGSLNSSKISGSGLIFRSPNRPTGNYVFSVFAKNINEDSSVIQLRIDIPASLSSEFDLSNGTIVSTNTDDAKIEDYGNGWYRCIVIQNNDGIANAVIANGETESLSCEIFGAMLEENNFVTSYIPTTSSTATRSAETCNNAGDVNTFNDSEGVLFWDGYIPNDGNEKILQISDGTNTNVVRIFARANGDDVRFQITDGGVNSLSQEIPISSNNYYKISLKYKENDISIWVNGFELYNVNNGSMPSNLNTLEFNSDGGANAFYGNTKQIQYFDTALNDTDLEELTSWVSFTDMANSQLYTIQ
ncbi:hypothetical protein [uncultured Polaribacter sp.]|mgnify:CR=1 FL=1|uniref:phage head spike fiber domain-containing protein n=1 Tax=uncultured Polaribacter sp. TaxID=174711 RepID=UPI00259B787C|nr:hypothetical protein [uncultured Polaribacter sp.]